MNNDLLLRIDSISIESRKEQAFNSLAKRGIFKAVFNPFLFHAVQERRYPLAK
jgi:hypothetical protein